MTAKDGTVAEVFEWLPAEVIQAAPTNAEVLKMWAAHSEVCDYVPLNQLGEPENMFADFTPFN